MTEAKIARRVTGIVVAATLLLLLLFSALVYQWITLGVQQRRLNNAEAEQARIEQAWEEAKEDQSELNDPSWKLDLAIKYGIIE